VGLAARVFGEARALALVVMLLAPATATADEGAVVSSPAAANPLARDHVDLGLHFGPAWRGNVATTFAPWAWESRLPRPSSSRGASRL
jgi:hypothetical protein